RSTFFSRLSLSTVLSPGNCHIEMSRPVGLAGRNVLFRDLRKSPVSRRENRAFEGIKFQAGLIRLACAEATPTRGVEGGAVAEIVLVVLRASAWMSGR